MQYEMMTAANGNSYLQVEEETTQSPGAKTGEVQLVA